MGGKGNEGTEPRDMKMTGVEGSGKKVNRKRERDRDIERREAKTEIQGVRVPAETALEDRAPVEKRGRQPRASEDVGGRAEIKGLPRPEKATPNAKVQKFSIVTPESDIQIDTPGPTEQQQQQQQQQQSFSPSLGVPHLSEGGGSVGHYDQTAATTAESPR
uniref:Uncharacterized protein n=1 Tax=Chromera velia CCMP2878 TaxID=1169474 RepID=A0A0G4I6C5_9ALVE|eukprot:Cvel_11372.t1-p1 / transcript=Cvel_11372.t1 / gene=Cvel_11372 / organism=Chromera_velia_CCMP2878 / gene_product=hypothetical protein / transcript_product=hypothetical protein / location=Cvel_scaffold713:7190-7669(+) / protein_length=160 / sequence_SO=supercontig / SO=protein_coding / is_pseudo=false